MTGQPGYDTFGPQYPPEWDDPEIPECEICGEQLETEEGCHECDMIDRMRICMGCFEDAVSVVRFWKETIQ